MLKHGMKDTPTYNSWIAMRKRCNNPNVEEYKNYGGRGITFDPRWDDFTEFLSDLGERPSGMTLDRIDFNGNYCKENCRWATIKEQNRNKSNVLSLTVNGVTKLLCEWADDYNIRQDTIWRRLQRGYSETDAVLTPLRQSIRVK